VTHYAPITLQVVDENSNELFSQSVPFEPEMDVKQVMERAFVLSQSESTPDPLVFTLQYYGYSRTSQFRGYLGYEVESICKRTNNQEYYWELLVNGVPSQEGADLEQPNSGANVIWRYTKIPPTAKDFSFRLRATQSRHTRK